jgi:hypothetical protein
MAYIGNTVQNQGFTPAIDYFNGNGVTVTFTLSRPVASVAQVIVAIDNVIQNPNSSFTVAGNAITFSSAPLSGTNNIWVEYTSLITTYQAISQDPTVIGDIRATGGYLAEGDFGNSFVDGAILDYVTGLGRITVGDADGLAIYNGGTAARTALMTVASTGNVGIGTTSPLDKIDANGRIRSNRSGNDGVFAFGNDSTPLNFVYGTGGSGGHVAVWTNSTERMRVGSSGDVAIGTTNPGIYSSSAKVVSVNTSAGNNTVAMALVNAAGDTNTSVSLDFVPNTNIALAQIQGFRTNAFGGATDFRFLSYDGSSLAERVRINSDGFLLVNTTTIRNSGRISVDYNGNAAGGSGINDTVSANGSTFIGFLTGGSFRGSINNNNNSSVAYNTTSDYRLKENIAPMTGALDTVAQLKPCTYVWKETGNAGQGFIAHELAEFVPDAVTGEKDAVDTDGNPKYQGVDTSFLVATLTAAIQELKATVDAQAARIAALEAK